MTTEPNGYHRIAHDPATHAEWVDDGWDPMTIAEVAPADFNHVARILAAPVDVEDGRSDWMWVRLANGDLALAVFPWGDTYFDTEVDRPI